jgi:hypothetical protein
MLALAAMVTEAQDPLDRIRHFARLSVRRGCAFAALAIFTTMFGLVATPVLAIKAGAFGFTLVCLTLLYKTYRAPSRDYRRTELWILLDRDHGMPEAFAGRVINGVLGEVYLQHAEFAALLAVLFWVLALVGWLFF